MTGFHFTSQDNWQQIQQRGLTPYLIDKPELRPLFPEPFEGIWLWMYPLTEQEELETLLWQVATKETLKLVKLAVDYYTSDLLTFDDEEGIHRVVVSHVGEFGNYKFHIDEPEAVICTGWIPPQDIRLEREYDFMDIVRQQAWVPSRK